MSEIIDRAARAAYEAAILCDPPPATSTLYAKTWDTISERMKEKSRAIARGVIVAIREPTDKMTNAPFAAGVEAGGYMMAGHEASDAWRAMIDEALK